MTEHVEAIGREPSRGTSARGEVAPHSSSFGVRAIAVLGVGYGDIGTSPIYASNVIELPQEIAGKAAAMQQTLQASHGELVEARRELVEIKVELQANRNLIEQDPLTGMGNRRAMSAILGREIAHSRRDKDPLSVAMVDIDHFKKINDLHGHAAGDAALLHLCQTAQSILRGSDAFVRYGGDEFLLVLPQTAAAGAVHVGERLQQLLLRHPFVHQGEVISMTFSAGVSTLNDTDDEATLVRRGDQALYKAKQTGRSKMSIDE